MTLKVMGIIEAEGKEIELAVYSHCLLEIFRLKYKYDQEKEAEDWMEKFGNVSFEELMKREQEEDGEE